MRTHVRIVSWVPPKRVNSALGLRGQAARDSGNTQAVYGHMASLTHAGAEGVSPPNRHPATWSSGSGRFLLGKNRMFESCCGYRGGLAPLCDAPVGVTMVEGVCAAGKAWGVVFRRH
jgi:hypothetical protein